ncbi:MAG: winged helix-turn-helix transcriptional regulator [Beijerinckiaceae bacterium]
MAGKRHYDDGCAAAHALELVGERWALLVIRELMLGPRRFTDLRTALPGISPNVLTQRLDELERSSILVRKKLPPPASVRVYELTDWGRELEPVIREIGRWAARSPSFPFGRPISANSLVLSLRTMFDASRARNMAGRIGIVSGGMEFCADIRNGNMTLEPESVAGCDVRISGDPNALAMVVYAGRPLAEAERSKEISVVGDKALAKRFIACFVLPGRAPETHACPATPA